MTGSSSVVRGWGRTASGGGAAAAGDLAGGLDDVVDEPVLEGLGRGEPAVTVGVPGDRLDRLAALLGSELRHRALHVQDELGLDLDVRGGAADAAERLGHEDTRVRQGV